MFWMREAAREWPKFMGSLLLSILPGYGLAHLLNKKEFLPEIALILVAFIYAVRLAIWSIKQIKK